MTGRYFEAVEAKWRTLNGMGPDWINTATSEAVWQRAGPAIRYLASSAEPYYWTEDTVRIVAHAASSLESCIVEPPMLPSPCGFCWLETPYEIDQTNIPDVKFDEETEYDRLLLRGFLWIAQDQLLVTVAFHSPPDDLDYLQPGTITANVFGRDILTIDHQADGYIANQARRDLSFVGASFLFLQQKLLVSRREALPRAVARRLAREGRDEDGVAVVYLRKPTYVGEQISEHAWVDWQYQWFVRGHWRDQPYGPGRELTRKVWIAPYIKGPDGKPLKMPNQRIFAVVQ